MNRDQKRALQRLIEEYVTARVQLSWLGSQPPEAHEGIRLREKQARETLESTIEGLARP